MLLKKQHGLFNKEDGLLDRQSGLYQRSNLSNGQFPLSIPNLLIWLDAQNELSITKTGTEVNKWQNSHNNNFVGNCPSGKELTYDDDGLNSLPCIVNESTDASNGDRLTFGNDTRVESDDFTVFAVVKKAVGAAPQAIFSCQAQSDTSDTEEAGWTFRFTGTEVLQVVRYSDGALQNQFGTATYGAGNYIVGLRKNGTTVNLYNQSGEDAVAGGLAITSPMEYVTAYPKVTTTHCVHASNGLSSSWLAPLKSGGGISELVFYHQVLTDAEITGMINYLKEKWGFV